MRRRLASPHTPMSAASLRRKSVESREHAVHFARHVFNGADKNDDGTLTKTEVRKYFKANPEDKVHHVARGMLSMHPTYLLTATQPPSENPIGVACSMRDVWVIGPRGGPLQYRRLHPVLTSGPTHTHHTHTHALRTLAPTHYRSALRAISLSTTSSAQPSPGAASSKAWTPTGTGGST